MGLADLRIHTTYSWDGTATVEQVLDQAAHRVGLDVIAITDRDEIRGSLRGRELGWQFGLQVITGMEMSRADGHVPALFIERPIAPGLSPAETIHAVGELGGLCIAPHPAARLSSPAGCCASRRLC